MTLTGWDISTGHPLPAQRDEAVAGFRACLGTSFVDPEYAARWREFKARGDAAVSLDYTFLSGPKRGQSIASQIAFYKRAHRAELACLDWEDDTYKLRGIAYKMGRQPFAAVLSGVHLAQQAGLDPGVYASLSLFTTSVVGQLIRAGCPYLWVAAYGVPIPGWLIDRCRKANVVLMHQYTGTGLDRSRVLVGTLADLHRIAGRTPAPAPSGEPMTNLVPLTCHRVVDIGAGGVLFKSPGGDFFTHLTKDVTLGFLGATATHYHVADGDAGVYLSRTDPNLRGVRTAEQNVGQ